MHSDNILFHPNLSTLISTLAENPEFKKEVRNQIEGLDIMNLDDISVENNILKIGDFFQLNDSFISIISKMKRVLGDNS